MAVGCAIAERFLEARFGNVVSHKTYAFISDGGIQEEISQGAGRIAGFLGLSNPIMFYDCNKVQLSTMVDAVDTEDYAAKYRAWHWNVIEIDGNDPLAIADALLKSSGRDRAPHYHHWPYHYGQGRGESRRRIFRRKMLYPRTAPSAAAVLTMLALSRTLAATPKIPGLSSTT